MDVSKKNTQRAIYIWNALGSAANSFSTLVLMLVVTRILGPVEGGIFSIAFALAQQAWSVVNCEMVTFQATDREDKYTFAQYNGVRWFLFIVSMAVMFGIVRVREYGTYKSAIVLLLCCYKCLDALSASFFALFQKNGRLDIAGRSMTFKTCISVVGFIVCCCLFENMLVATIVMNFLYIIGVFLWDVRFLVHYEKFSIVMDRGIFRLFLECFPLFIGSFMTVYICNQPKYVLDIVSTAEMQTVFNIIAMPAFVINLLSMFVFRPYLTQIAVEWNNACLREFKTINMKLYGVIALCTVLCIIGGCSIGVPILSMLYGVELSSFKTELAIVLFGGGLNAVSVLSYNILSAIRKQQYVLIAYACAIVVSLGISKSLIKRAGMMGASLSYMIPFMIIAILLMLCIVMETRKKQRRR